MITAPFSEEMRTILKAGLLRHGAEEAVTRGFNMDDY